MKTIEISFTREEVFLQLRQDGGRATSPDSPVCHFDFSCFLFFVVFFFSQGSQGISERSYVYIYALCGFKFQSVDYSLKSFTGN